MSALEQLLGLYFFTKLDLQSKYNLVHIRKGGEWKTAFSTTCGHYHAVWPCKRSISLSCIHKWRAERHARQECGCVYRWHSSIPTISVRACFSCSSGTAKTDETSWYPNSVSDKRSTFDTHFLPLQLAGGHPIGLWTPFHLASMASSLFVTEGKHESHFVIHNWMGIQYKTNHPGAVKIPLNLLPERPVWLS